ncbi:MAG: helix-hairpin-helix domain-containing protein [Bacteroidales bacterium]|nr:helix-hairpin-helix domain-containing protein [Bacteroidales bacterium]MDD3989976.1 helix-hairpin-helix domain-containing protein [Bacteroidales bacterium]
MKRGRISKSHASGVVILVFTVLFVQGVLFLFSKEELKLRNVQDIEKQESEKQDVEKQKSDKQGIEKQESGRSATKSTGRELTGSAGDNNKSGNGASVSGRSKHTTQPGVIETDKENTPAADPKKERERQTHDESSKGTEYKEIPWSSLSKSSIIQLNTTDSAELVSLPGIGPYYAKKILEYRDLLGGFASREQLMEIRGIDRERYDLIADKVSADTTLVKKTDLRDVTYEQLARNPYVGGYLARSIIRFREQNIGFPTDLNSLLSASIIKKELYKILKYYFR